MYVVWSRLISVRTLGFALVAVFLLSPAVVMADYDLPTMGQPANTILPPAKAEHIGQRVISQLHARHKLLQDPELNAYINRLGRRLVRHTRKPPSDFNFYIVNNQTINAFALPGGYIAVNAGLILKTDTESQLAGVMAHEVSHVTQRHIARQIRSSRKVTIATAAAMLLAVIAGGGNPAVVEAAITMGIANIGMKRIQYTRAHELEADRLGIKLLAEANFNPRGMAAFFEKMAERARLYGNRLPEILRTHPFSTTRIAEARSRLGDVAVTNIKESPAYMFMRARARVLSSNRPNKVVQHFQRKRQNQESSPAADYGYALALMAIGNAQAALPILRQLEESGAGEPHVALALSDALLASGQEEAALSVLATLRDEYRNYRPLTLAYANVLIANDRLEQAHAFLQGQSQLLGRDPLVHKMLARVAAKRGHEGIAYYQQARMSYLQGRYAMAIRRLKRALEHESLSADSQAEINATLSRYRKACERALSASKCQSLVKNGLIN